MITTTPGPGTRAIKANEWKPGKTAAQWAAESLAYSHTVDVLLDAIAIKFEVLPHDFRNKAFAWILELQAKEWLQEQSV